MHYIVPQTRNSARDLRGLKETVGKLVSLKYVNLSTQFADFFGRSNPLYCPFHSPGAAQYLSIVTVNNEKKQKHPDRSLGVM